MSNNKNIYTTIQVRRDFNGHIKEFCKKHGVNSSKITELSLFCWVEHWGLGMVQGNLINAP